ncbi:hypothetical protein D3C80_1896350 [compost metagenome]
MAVSRMASYCRLMFSARFPRATNLHWRKLSARYFLCLSPITRLMRYISRMRVSTDFPVQFSLAICNGESSSREGLWPE